MINKVVKTPVVVVCINQSCYLIGDSHHVYYLQAFACLCIYFPFQDKYYFGDSFVSLLDFTRNKISDSHICSNFDARNVDAFYLLVSSIFFILFVFPSFHLIMNS